MEYKWIGAGMVILTCGGFGLGCAGDQVREERILRQLSAALDHMACKLHYDNSPLPELFRSAAELGRGRLYGVFSRMWEMLDARLDMDAAECMTKVLDREEALPRRVRQILLDLGPGLGRLDAQGQIRNLNRIREDCQLLLRELEQDRASRLRGIRTLGFCGGAALAILLM